jgi:hypothetical protein
VLGATVQETRYNETRRAVVVEGQGGKVLNGWNVLSNNQVGLTTLFSMHTQTVFAGEFGVKRPHGPRYRIHVNSVSHDRTQQLHCYCCLQGSRRI